MPDWIEIGLPELVAGSPRADFLIARLAAQTDSVRPLAAFFAAGRPADGGDTLRGREERADDSRDPYGGMAGMGRAGARTSGPAGRVGRGRGARVLSGAELFDAQAIAVARFLLQRERAEFLGSAADALATGVRIDELLARTEAPVTVAALEPEWRAWLSRQRVDDRLRGR